MVLTVRSCASELVATKPERDSNSWRITGLFVLQQGTAREGKYHEIQAVSGITMAGFAQAQVQATQLYAQEI